MNLSPTKPVVAAPLWILAFGFAISGPLMALAPRFMPGAIVLATLTMLPLLFFNRKNLGRFFSQRIVWLVLATIAYTCISATWSVAPRPLTAVIDMAYLSLCAITLAIEVKLVPQKMRELYLLIFTLSLVVGFFFMAEEFISSHFLFRVFNRVAEDGFISDNVTKRMVAIFSITVWPVAAYLEQKRNRIWGFALVAMLLGFSLIATSRAAALGMILGFVVLLAAYVAPKLARWGLIALLVIGLVGVVPAFYAVDHMPDTVKDRLFGSAQYRLKIWQYTARHVPEKLWLGHGIDSSRGLQTDVGLDGAPFMKPGVQIIAQHPHNIFLQLWLDLGLVGAALWGALMLLLANCIRKLPITIQPYALGAAFCSLGLLCTTYSILQAWWASAHICAALMLLLLAQTMSSNAVTNGASAGGMAKPLNS